MELQISLEQLSTGVSPVPSLLLATLILSVSFSVTSSPLHSAVVPMETSEQLTRPSSSTVSGIVLTESCSVAIEFACKSEDGNSVTSCGMEIGVSESNSKLGELMSSTPLPHAITIGTGMVEDSSDWLISSMDNSLH